MQPRIGFGLDLFALLGACSLSGCGADETTIAPPGGGDGGDVGTPKDSGANRTIAESGAETGGRPDASDGGGGEGATAGGGGQDASDGGGGGADASDGAGGNCWTDGGACGSNQLCVDNICSPCATGSTGDQQCVDAYGFGQICVAGACTAG
jgi:hypothetical protein